MTRYLFLILDEGLWSAGRAFYNLDDSADWGGGMGENTPIHSIFQNLHGFQDYCDFICLDYSIYFLAHFYKNIFYKEIAY